MLVPEESVEILAELGLSHTEAKVYLALLLLKTATARNIHRVSSVARQDVYQTLSDLEEKGLIEKVITKPARFRPISASDAIPILLQRKTEQNHQLRDKAVQHFRNLEVRGAEQVSFDKSAQFLLLSKSETNPTGHIDRLGKAVDGARRTVVALITFPLFMKVKLMDEGIWKRVVERGVRCRFIIGGSEVEKSEMGLDPVLENADGFEIRWTSRVPPTTVLLIDDREVFCRIGDDLENPVLWSGTPRFVAMIKDYLRMKWKLLEQPRKQQVLSK